jgi:hypothetical protein
VLHRTCIDTQSRPTDYAEQLARRYGALSTKVLLRHLAALDPGGGSSGHIVSSGPRREFARYGVSVRS